MDNLQLLYSNNCGDSTYLVLSPVYCEMEDSTVYLRPGQIVTLAHDITVHLVSLPRRMWAVA
jgi:hypothetical protein